jgi:hypothetical protein
MVQKTGYQRLKATGITLIAADSSDQQPSDVSGLGYDGSHELRIGEGKNTRWMPAGNNDVRPMTPRERFDELRQDPRYSRALRAPDSTPTTTPTAIDVGDLDGLTPEQLLAKNAELIRARNPAAAKSVNASDALDNMTAEQLLEHHRELLRDRRARSLGA